MKPKKLIREFITSKLKEGEWEIISSQEELNGLYALKIEEELREVQESEHKDIKEFVDLIQVAYSFAKENGFTQEELSIALLDKSSKKGMFGRLVLNNLNPNNPSNDIYFEEENAKEVSGKKYSLSYLQAIQIVLDGGAVKGESFANGVFLRMNNAGQLVTVDANIMYKESTCIFIKLLSTQKFRSLSVMTLKELSH